MTDLVAEASSRCLESSCRFCHGFKCGGLLTSWHLPRLGARTARDPPADAAADELEMLEFTARPRQANSHFACQVALTGALDGLAVGLPVSQH